VIFYGRLDGFFAFAAAVNAGQIRLFDGEFFENMGVDVLVKTFRIFVFYLEFHVFEFGNTRF